MKNIVKAAFNALGLEVRRKPAPQTSKARTADKHAIEFIQEDTYKVEFTRITVSGNQYFAPKYASHRPAVKNLLNGSLYEPDTHEFVSGFCAAFKGSMVHAGTFFGDMIPNFSKFVAGKVYAFEPVFENYILARLCVNSNRLSNVILLNSALSDNLGNLHINTTQSDGEHAGGASTISEDGEICVAMSIDMLNIDDLVLLQLDVEGHELIALTGAKQTIQRTRPVIAIEDNNNNCAEFLSGHAYENIGHIPGLSIWAPQENDRYKETVRSLIK